MMFIRTFLRRCALALTLATCSLAASADPINFHVDLDTSALGAGSGYVDFYFGANSADSFAGSATISHLAGFGPLGYTAGGVTANANGSYTLTNLPALDNFFGLAASFPGAFSFDVAFDAGFLSYFGTDHSALTVSLFDTDFNLLGAASTFDLQPGNVLGGASIVVTAGDGATISAVPEPSQLLLVLTALAAVVLIRRQRS
jgi:hypothetical protein